MTSTTCPKCGTENPGDAMNCRQCRINLKFALEHPEEIEAIKQREQGLASTPEEPSLPKNEQTRILIGGILAIVFAWAAGVVFGSYTVTESFPSLTEVLSMSLNIDSYASSVLCFSLCVPWYIVGKLAANRSNVIFAIIVGVIIASVGGCSSTVVQFH